MSEEQQNLQSITPKKRERGQKLTTPEKSVAQDVFLESFSKHGNIMLACKDAGVTRTTLYQWKEKPQFLKRYDAALEDAKDNIKAEVYRRGHDGVDEPMLNMGRPVYDEDGKIMMVKKYSDSLLMFHAKMLMPEYRDKQQVDANINHSGSIDSKTIALDPKTLTDDEIKAMKEVLFKAVQREQE